MKSTKRTREQIYKIIFHNQGKIYEIFAKVVTQGELFGFILVEDLLFGEKTQVVVDPAEESLKLEFEGVKRIHIPLHAVVRIDEVARRGAIRITELEGSGGKVSPFPSALYTPGGEDKKS